MFSLKMNPRNNRVFLYAWKGYTSNMLSYNGTTLGAPKKAADWPEVGLTPCLFEWQAGNVTLRDGWTIKIENGDTPNAQAIAVRTS